MEVVCESFLHYADGTGTSDKVYVSRVITLDSQRHVHVTGYGRRGGTLREHIVLYPIQFDAKMVHSLVTYRKVAKGYSHVLPGVCSETLGRIPALVQEMGGKVLTLRTTESCTPDNPIPRRRFRFQDTLKKEG